MFNLYFHLQVSGTNSRKSEPVNLTFDNHTECHCIERINSNANVAKLVETEEAALKEAITNLSHAVKISISFKVFSVSKILLLKSANI